VEPPFDDLFYGTFIGFPKFFPFWVDFDVSSSICLHFEVNPRSSCTICFLMSLYFFLSPKHAVELNKQISCTLQLTNKTDKQVAFKVKRIILVNSSGKSSVITRKWQRWD